MRNEVLSKDTLIYDGKCRFCHRWASRLVWLTRGRLHVVPYQVPEVPDRYGVSREACENSVQLVTSGRHVYAGAEAAARALQLNATLGWLYHIYIIPGIRQICDAFYHWTAVHRHELS